jgi:hypothetical protein
VLHLFCLLLFVEVLRKGDEDSAPWVGYVDAENRLATEHAVFMIYVARQRFLAIGIAEVALGDGGGDAAGAGRGCAAVVACDAVTFAFVVVDDASAGVRAGAAADFGFGVDTVVGTAVDAADDSGVGAAAGADNPVSAGADAVVGDGVAHVADSRRGGVAAESGRKG